MNAGVNASDKVRDARYRGTVQAHLSLYCRYSMVRDHTSHYGGTPGYLLNRADIERPGCMDLPA